MKKISKSNCILLGVFFIFLAVFSLALAQTQESLTITTYYPSPLGSYLELRNQRMAIGPTWFNANTHCWPGGPCGVPDIDANANLVVEGNVGIGTLAPTAKLVVEPAGAGSGPGIIARTGNENAISGIYGGIADYVNRVTGIYGKGVVMNSRGGYFEQTGGGATGYGIYVDAAQNYFSGNVGIGVIAPGSPLHVSSATDNIANFQTTDDSWLYVQWLRNSGQRRAWMGLNGALNEFHIDVENGTNEIIFNGGFVGIGTATPQNNLDVVGRMAVGAAYAGVAPGTANGMIIEGRVGIGTASPNHPLHMGSGAFCSVPGNWTDASDIAYKKNITDLRYGLKEVLELQPREFDVKVDNSHSIGFIAQEMEKVIPEVVSGEEGQKGISYGNLTALLVNALKEQQKEIESLKTEIAELKFKLSDGE